VASDAGFWVNSFNGTGWVGWTKIGTATYVGNPGCAKHWWRQGSVRGGGSEREGRQHHWSVTWG
jgi:hypothetical protein